MDNKKKKFDTEAGLAGAAQGVTGNFADEMYGGIFSALSKAGLGDAEQSMANAKAIADLSNSKNPGMPVEVPSLYETARNSSRQDFNDAEQRSPSTFTGGKIMGGLAQAALPLGSVAGATTKAAAATRGALGGALSAGAENLGEQEELSKEGAFSALKSALKGGVVGGTLGALLPGAKEMQKEASLANAKNLIQSPLKKEKQFAERLEDYRKAKDSVDAVNAAKNAGTAKPNISPEDWASRWGESAPSPAINEAEETVKHMNWLKDNHPEEAAKVSQQLRDSMESTNALNPAIETAVNNMPESFIDRLRKRFK